MSKQINFTNHMGEKLAATLHIPEGPARGGVVLGHCFTCSRHTGILREISQGLAGQGLLALRFDFSGNGQSQGEFVNSSYSKHIREMEMAVAFLRQQGVNWIGLTGHSMGAAIAVLSAARIHGVRAVCALAGRLSGLSPTHFLNVAQKTDLEVNGEVSFESRGRTLKLSRDFFADAKSHDLPHVIANLEVPALVVHGTLDEIIPVAEAQKAHDFNPGIMELEIIEGVDHMFSDPGQRRDTARRVVNWFALQASGKAQSRPDTPTPSTHSRTLLHENS
jgi:dienelactone hydrolase